MHVTFGMKGVILSSILVLLFSSISHSLQFGRYAVRKQSSSPSKLYAATTTVEPLDELTKEKFPWKEEGYKSWTFQGHTINYVDVGAANSGEAPKPPLLLIHGFGASVFHWRYNIPELAKQYHVFAIDLLGFGLSDKPIIEYSADVWRDQALSFIEEIVQPVNNLPCVVAGNSLGGYTALSAAASDAATSKNLIRGCILLNAAGRFKDTSPVEEDTRPQWLQDLSAAFQRFVIGLSFVYTKQPARIQQVLKQVYPVDPSNVDAELVESIRFPAQNPNAPEVFYRVVSRNGRGPPTYVDDLLSTLKVPLLLCWGEQDPWIRPLAADKIQALFPAAKRVSINAGHCPHDEAPEAVNSAIADWMKSLA